MRSLDDIREEYEFLEGDERYRLLIELGRDLEEMPAALKTDATLVRRYGSIPQEKATSCIFWRTATQRSPRGSSRW